MWRQEGKLSCIARDIGDHALLSALSYFYPGEAVTFCLAPNHQIDRLLDFVRKERAIEDLYSGDSAKQLRELAEEAPHYRAGEQSALSGRGPHCFRYSHRAGRRPVRGPHACRWRSAYQADPARGTLSGRCFPDQAHLGNRHRRTPTSPGRKDLHASFGTGDGHQGLDRALRVRRVHRVADACKGARRPRIAEPRHGGRPPRPVPELVSREQRNRARHRPDGVGKIHDARGCAGGSRRRHQEAHHGRRPGSSTRCRTSRRSRPTRRSATRSRARSAPSCDKTPT